MELFFHLIKNQYLCTRFKKKSIKKRFKYINYIMTKAEIVLEIAANTGIARKDVSTVVEAMMETIKNHMIAKENVFLRGFGSFVVKHRAEKTARNISKNTTIMIAAHDFPTFKPAKSFADKMK